MEKESKYFRFLMYLNSAEIDTIDKLKIIWLMEDFEKEEDLKHNLEKYG